MGAHTLSVTFTPGNTANYGSASATTNVNLVVSPAALTVTASNATRAYGQPNPVFGGTITGLQNRDNITAIYTCNATTNTAPGTYAIVPSLVDPNNLATNYTVTLSNGTLTIIQPGQLVQNGNFETGDFSFWTRSAMLSTPGKLST